MKKYARIVAIAAALAFLAFFASIGALTVFLAPHTGSYVPQGSADVAAWVQAITAGLAIFASAWLALHVQARSENTARKQAAEAASEVALYARNLLTLTRDQFSTRQGVFDVATHAIYFDLTALEDLWAMMSAISMQEVRSAQITRELLILRGTIRQFNRNVHTAIKRHAEMNAAEYDTLFRVLNDATTGAAKVHSRIEGYMSST
ncbi:hypothetical protein IPU70_07970 [Achromobacter sp. SD115]|uniref:hypothetical protein n=1 Tax=Achromobacter sp. SD115 TaxID=2782011 RepID=UPI001A967A04|nr:hypothetical protein [Achromobacter sp. SD115]MBO1013480.1 hypothetical protein [Achromobacter sp. SD115]